MSQVAYINMGDERRKVRIIEDDGTIEEYNLSIYYPEHIQLIMDLDAQVSLRSQIESLYIEPSPF